MIFEWYGTLPGGRRGVSVVHLVRAKGRGLRSLQLQDVKNTRGGNKFNHVGHGMMCTDVSTYPPADGAVYRRHQIRLQASIC